MCEFDFFMYKSQIFLLPYMAIEIYILYTVQYNVYSMNKKYVYLMVCLPNELGIAVCKFFLTVV
jgi:hypothetical protein